MNAPNTLLDSRLNPHLDAALQRVRTAAEQAAERCGEGLGLSALSAGNLKRRDALLSAQFLFRKQQGAFGLAFHQHLRTQVTTEQGPAPAEAEAPRKKDWSELSLMDDDQVDALVAADRIGLALGHQCEWELREVESYAFAISAGERNPLRPELIGGALLEGVNAVSDETQVREILVDEMTRAMAQEMRACYADIAELFRNRGLRPQDLRVRGSDPNHSVHGPHSTRQGAPSGHGEFDPRAGGPVSTQGHQPGGYGVPGGYGAPGGHGGGHGGSYAGGVPGGAPAGYAGGMPSGIAAGAPGAYAGGRGGVVPPGAFGRVDPQMMELLRRLSQVPVGGGMAGGIGGAPAGIGGFAPSQPGVFDAYAGSEDYGSDAAAWAAAPLPPNLIHLHRDELRQAATGRLDHMVIDVVGSLFDQILSDAKVPPQMARLIARLQLPVLRVALGDPTFFSVRRHPVRRFVNRMASLACAYDDFAEDPGRGFLALVRELVQDVAGGDFERMDVYESKLDALEAFIAEQTAATLKAQGDAAALVERKETELRQQQRYMQQLRTALGPVLMPDFLRDFLAQVWSQAIVTAVRDGAPEQAMRLRQFGRDLVMSVQAKTGSAQRQTFLGQLPALMRTLNEGLDLIQWPESARKAFFAQLLPAHAESLKSPSVTPLESNLLAKQLEQIFGCAPPSEAEVAKDGPISVPQDLDVGTKLSAAEAASLGLVGEASVDWNGAVDIDLTGDPSQDVPLQAVDISIDGLPAAEAPEPSQGALLVDHLQLGFAYQMNTGEQWHKVRLAHISAGRSFFIFTQGQKHQETVTMTARMLKRMCEAGRLKAFENAYLLERATARARKQLAELGARS
ncbi:MAG: DUF1631 family protein [Pelomonas sp.]|nr:DUF1631 family protein [Roseateles sp.]